MELITKYIKPENIWCICLADRDDRYQAVKAEFERVGIPVNFYRPQRDPLGGTHGCWMSHRYCIQRIKNNGGDGLIFEDDVIFSDDSDTNTTLSSKLATLHNFTHKYRYDIFWLGGIISSLIDEISSGIWRCNSYNTHAYMISEYYAQELLVRNDFNPESNPGIGIDDYFHSLDKNTNLFYTFSEPICYQSDSPSDNQWFSFNILQSIVQSRSWLKVQKASNSWAWHLRWLPVPLQECLNPFPALVTLNVKYTLLVQSIKQFMSSTHSLNLRQS